MKPPPGNSGGAVSGAGPWPRILGAQNSRTSANHAHIPTLRRVTFSNFTSFPPEIKNKPQAHGCLKPEAGTTGGQTKCEEAGKPGNRRWAERGNGQRCCEQRN